MRLPDRPVRKPPRPWESAQNANSHTLLGKASPKNARRFHRSHNADCGSHFEIGAHFSLTFALNISCLSTVPNLVGRDSVSNLQALARSIRRGERNLDLTPSTTLRVRLQPRRVRNRKSLDTRHTILWNVKR